MRQVDRKRGYFIILFAVLFLISGCAVKNDPTVSHKSFDKNITKDQLLHAVKRVFTLTDREAFILDTYRNDINATKPKAVHRFYTMDIQNDHFDFKVDDNSSKPTLNATISISRTYGIEGEDRHYIKEDSFTYELFWDRVEYLLGLQESWRICTYEYLDGFLCDMIELQNSWADEEDLIDLNSSLGQVPKEQEMINLHQFYQKTSTEEKKARIIEEIHLIDNNKNTKGKGESQEKETKQEDVLRKEIKVKNIDDISSDTKSFKINIEEIEKEKLGN